MAEFLIQNSVDLKIEKENSFSNLIQSKIRESDLLSTFPLLLHLLLQLVPQVYILLLPLLTQVLAWASQVQVLQLIRYSLELVMFSLLSDSLYRCHQSC